MLFVCCAFSVLIVHCHGIAEEYYDDRFVEDVPLLVNNTLDSSGAGGILQNSSLDQNKSSRKIYDNPNFNHEHDDELKIFVIGSNDEKYRSKILSFTTTKPSTKTTQSRLKYVTTDNITTREQSLHFFRDYEYVYSDDTTQEKPFLVIPEDDVGSSTSVNTEQNKTKVFHTDFYNLEPAAVIPKLNENVMPDTRMWYVPEKYPCWELPVLYGELGKKKNTSEIFLVNNGDLKNVIEVQRQNKPIFKTPDFQESNPLNKWCAAQPCYGDHTLCLFSDNSISKICDSKYTVGFPTIVRTIEIVNTVNAMRNRIANGAADEYRQLPPAQNMKQIIYDYDLEKMAAAWLRQCLPGPPPCSALDDHYVTQLECTKYADKCCINSDSIDPTSKWYKILH